MTSLRPNLVKRIARLPKPTSVADALQPLFEAISNAIHSTQGRFKEHVARDGHVEVRGGSGNLHRRDEWSFCLTAARMAAEQERR